MVHEFIELSRKTKNMTGEHFGRLTVCGPVERIVRGEHVYVKWLCQCKCGKTKRVDGSNLRQGRTKSCGCLSIENSLPKACASNRTHGESKTPEYKVWLGMHQRCGNIEDKSFKDYGDRGIRVCERWSSFEAFIEDMGPRQGQDLSIERIDVNKGYAPDNCRWATMSDQNVNKRNNLYVTAFGRVGALSTFIPQGSHSAEYQRARKLIHKGVSGEMAIKWALEGTRG